MQESHSGYPYVQHEKTHVSSPCILRLGIYEFTENENKSIVGGNEGV